MPWVHEDEHSKVTESSLRSDNRLEFRVSTVNPEPFIILIYGFDNVIKHLWNIQTCIQLVLLLASIHTKPMS